MQQPLLHFNRGLVSPLALARVDQKRVAISAEVQTNWMPRVLGPMSLRPGWEYITGTHNNAESRYIPFIFSTTDTALVELTTAIMRVIVDDVVITRPSVTAAVTNGNFTADVTTGWTDNSDAGGTLSWSITGALVIQGDGTDYGIIDQEVTVNQAGTEHALRVIVVRGPVILRVGSVLDGDDYITETSLGKGEHSLSFTPTDNFFIRMKSNVKRAIFVDSINVESSGIMTLPTPWTATELDIVRFDQSGDVLFVACKGFQQRRIERRSERSWSVITYEPLDGPFRTENIDTTTITAAAISGNTTLTASVPIFKSTNVGGLFSVTSNGQEVSASISSQNTFTNSIKVTGITSDRIFTIVLSGVSDSTITLQRSLESDAGPWSDVVGKTWTANTTETYDDGLDNQIVWYQIGIKTGDYGTDTVAASLDYASGSITGIGRITAFTASDVVDVEVLTDFGGTEATDVWAEGTWSDRRGWPSSVALHEGRLWWAGGDKIIGSISDAFDQFDSTLEGDAGPIQRSIGSGPVDTINWILSLQRMILGGDGAEHSVRSSSFDEPMTPTNFMIRDASTQGSAKVSPIKIDQLGVYIQRSGIRVYLLEFDTQTNIDFSGKDLTLLAPELGSPGITRMAVQRQADTRIHCIRSNGTAMISVYDKVEDVLAWIDIETDGQIEDVVVLPGDLEDRVYYAVRRTINGSTVRYLEKWALETECRGGTLNKQADAFTVFTGPSATVTGLSHLEGEDVVVWADGEDVGTEDDYTQTYTVNGGQITLSESATDVVVGMPYTSRFKSAKLAAQGDAVVAALTSKKRMDRIGLTLAWVHPKGLRYGQDFDHLEDMPEIESGETIDPDTIRDSYAEDPILVSGNWAVDTRLCLQGQAPRPCTVMAAVPDIDIGG